MQDPVLKRIRDYQLDLFDTFDEFFRSTTGGGPEDFNPEQTITNETWGPFVGRFNTAMTGLMKRLEVLYKSGKQQFGDAGDLGGLKLVFGGGSRFYGTQFNAVRQMTMYADTILLPDPVFAWTEADRDDASNLPLEVFKTIHWLLQLKPLIGAKTDVPPVVVFPSFEKSLENTDEFTQTGMKDLVTNYFNAGLGIRFSSIEDVAEYADNDGERFLADVERSGLYVPSGSNSPRDARSALQQYREIHLASRSEQHIEQAKELTDAKLMFVAIFESVAPQFHLFENSGTLAAQPFMCFPNLLVLLQGAVEWCSP